jgi:hypothetical protein
MSTVDPELSMKRSEFVLALGFGILIPQIQFAQTIKFAAPRVILTSTTNSRPQYPLFGDFDNDGNTDILVSVDGHLNVLFGDGAGVFSILESNSTPGGAMFPLAVADVNGDGKSDVIMETLAVNKGSDGAISIFIGDGKGHFTPGAQYPVPYGYYQAVTGDFNGDGIVDFVVNAINNDPVVLPAFEQQIIFKGRGDGTFTTSALNLTSEGGIGTDALPFSGDFDGDGNLDLAFQVYPVDFSGTDLYLAYGRGDGTFSDPQLAYVTDSAAEDLAAVADLNGDGKSDLILSLTARTSPGAQPRIATLLAKQTEGFYWKSAVSLSNLGNASVSDLNGDGKADLIAYGNEPEYFDLYLWVYPGLGGGAFGEKSVVDTSSISSAIFTQFTAVPLRHGDLPSIIAFDAKHDQLELLLNITE